MKLVARDLTEQYAAVLREYFEGGGERPLLQAFELGREALAADLGVLEIAAVHQEALVAALLEMLAPEESARIARRAAEVFAESLAPFEMTRRGTQEANAVLRDANRQLEERASAIFERYRATRTQLDEGARREELKNELISIVSHELRTPLTSIHGALGLINTGLGGELSPQARRLLEVAYRNSRRLVRLVDDILDLEKIESGTIPFEVQALNLLPLLQQALEANQTYGSALGVNFELAEPAETLTVRVDAERLMQVLTNLLSNAAKFSAEGDKVVVAAWRNGAVVRVSVSDRGPGIPEEFQGRIFQRFAQAAAPGARVRNGNGLGLSISKAILERMGGAIGFETRLGEGTTFYFELPEAREERDAAAGAQ